MGRSVAGLAPGRVGHCRRVVLIGGLINLGGLCGLIDSTRVGGFGNEPLALHDGLSTLHRKLVINSTYRTNRLFETMFRNGPRSRLLEVTDCCSCLRVRPLNGGSFVIQGSARPSRGGGGNRAVPGPCQRIADIRVLGTCGHGVIRVTSRLRGPIITANSIRFLGGDSRVVHGVLLTNRGCSSFSCRTPLCLGAARRVLSSFSCFNRHTGRFMVSGPGGVTRVVDNSIVPIPRKGCPPIVRNSSRLLHRVY